MASLDAEIKKHRAEVRTVQWSVSVGEVFSLYARSELEINPAFQRFFRWSDTQKTYLVESVLLGLPIPPLFLAQTDEGVLEVVDGVQRLSTLLQLRAVLLGPGEKDTLELRPPLVMTAGQYLTQLEGLTWDEDAELRARSQGLDVQGVLTDAQRSDIQFAKLDATLIQRTSGEQAKYDVFRRLNSYGEPLTPQEMRAALIASANGDCLAWLASLARDGDTPELLALSERQLERQYDIELVLRFFYLVEAETLRAVELRDFPKLLDDLGTSLAAEYPSKRTEKLGRVFLETVEQIAEQAGSDFFRRYYPEEARFKGPFLNTSFEALASAVGYRLLRRKPVGTDLKAKVEKFWETPELQAGFASGRSTEWRLATYVPLGRELLGP